MVESHRQPPALSRRNYCVYPEPWYAVMVDISKRSTIRHRTQIAPLHLLYTFHFSQQLIDYRKFQPGCLYYPARWNAVPIRNTGYPSRTSTSGCPGAGAMATSSPESQYPLCDCSSFFKASTFQFHINDNSTCFT